MCALPEDALHALSCIICRSQGGYRPRQWLRPSGTSASAADRVCRGPSAPRALTDECFLRAHHAELVSLGVGQDSPGFSAGLPDVGAARSEREEAVNLLIAVRGAAGEVKMHAVLDRLGVGDRHEADADGRVL